MKKKLAALFSGALLLVSIGGATSMASKTKRAQQAPRPAATAQHCGGDAVACLTAWRCPITDEYYTSPFVCKANCDGYTCQPVCH